MADPSIESFPMTTQHPWTNAELEVFAYIQNLVQTKQVRLSSDVEPIIRRQFDWVTMTNSYHLAITYGRYRQKIDTILAERQRAEDPENVQTNCCHTCEAAS